MKEAVTALGVPPGRSVGQRSELIAMVDHNEFTIGNIHFQIPNHYYGSETGHRFTGVSTHSSVG